MAHDGPDVAPNGIALTPTLHAFFDGGFLTFRYVGSALRLRLSPLRDLRALPPPDTACRLGLRDGQAVALPDDRREWPDSELLRYHAQHIFRR